MPQRAATAQPAQRTQPAQAAQRADAGGQPRIGVPDNEAELRAISILRSELRSQVEAVTELRQELTNQLAQARAVDDGAGANEVIARIRTLETRSATLQQQILQADDAIATALARGVGSNEGVTFTIPPAPMPPVMSFPRRGVDEEVVVTALLSITLVFAFLGVLLYRWGWRRAKKQFASAGSSDPAQIQNLQQAVDVIAVEVERISEGQRFVSKLLNERFEGAAPERERVLVPKDNAGR
ncbi:MAG: hypothetical protein ACREOK_11970 [Gemmatimonadaceae bacterium]